jgi:hypothetical protein
MLYLYFFEKIFQRFESIILDADEIRGIRRNTDDKLSLIGIQK